MMIYSQHYFRRKMRKMPIPSCLPLAIMFAIISVCIIVVIPPIINGINIELPKINTQPVEIFEDFKYITIYVQENGTTLINGANSTIEESGSVIKIIYNGVNIDDIKIFIMADKNAKYDLLINLIQSLNNDGFTDITLVGKYTGGIQNI